MADNLVEIIIRVSAEQAAGAVNALTTSMEQMGVKTASVSSQMKEHQVVADEVTFLDAPKAGPAAEPEPAPEPRRQENAGRRPYRRVS